MGNPSTRSIRRQTTLAAALRRLPLALATLALLPLASPANAAPNWQRVFSGKGEQVDLDTRRITRSADGRILVWTRLMRDKPVTDTQTGTAYTALEVLNSYDCGAGRFATLKRLYLSDDKLLRVEPIYAPKDIAASASGPDAGLMAEACSQKVAALLPKADTPAIAAEERSPGVMHAEMVSDARQSKTTVTPVADKPAEAAGSAPPKRYIELPKIDKSMVEHPTDEAPAAEAKADDKKSRPEAKTEDKPKKPGTMTSNALAEAMKAVAEKAGTAAKSPAPSPAPAAKPAPAPPEPEGIDRHAREMALATSGLPRAPRKKPAPPANEPREAQEPVVARDVRDLRVVRATRNAAAESAVEQHRSLHWNYEGDGGPADWSRLDPKNAMCGIGKRQSPIDISEGIKVDLEAVKFDYKPTRFRIEDNGHTIQVNVGEGSTITIMGRSYELKQFHFHRPSEEKVNGKRFDMVAHLVHKDDDGNLAVVAVLLEKGASEHPLIQTLWNNMPLEAGMSLTPEVVIDLNKLLPTDRGYYTYMGSLTTPPCSENVLWMVFKQPVGLSAEQVAIFSRLYKNNARPIQPVNGRLIKESR